MKTLEELKSLKKQWYETAYNTGMISKIYTVCRTFGMDLYQRYGPKYEYINGNIKVYVDDWGHYMDVTVDGKIVCSTHPCNKIFVPGSWTNVIESAHQAATEVQEGKQRDQRERERLKLARELGIE